VSLWCLLFDPHQTTFQLNIGVQLIKHAIITITIYYLLFLIVFWFFGFLAQIGNSIARKESQHNHLMRTSSTKGEVKR
jgi:Na+/H+ antiporter NhaC